jgi:hypothetical protein
MGKQSQLSNRVNHYNLERTGNIDHQALRRRSSWFVDHQIARYVNDRRLDTALSRSAVRSLRRHPRDSSG